VGRFSPQKDPVTFLRAAREIAQAVPGAQFVVCGEDNVDIPVERDPRVVARDLGLDEAVHFVGFRRDVANVFRAVDLVMHSSRYEGMGRGVCEALVCGRPVAGTAVDGVVEAIVSGERGGILVPAGDHSRLALAAIELLRDPTWAQRLAEVGRRWVEHNLSHERMIASIEATYLELLNQSSPRTAGSPIQEDLGRGSTWRESLRRQSTHEGTVGRNHGTGSS
jgi:glycosyltransferase involved in cell wall biosynthesis